jgi:hypothetical protein
VRLNQEGIPGMPSLPSLFAKRRAWVRAIGSALAVLMLSSLACLPLQARQDKRKVGDAELCYAFLHQGDLWTVCQGKREHIALGGKAFEIAVSADGSSLAFVEGESWSAATGVIKSKSILVSLKVPFKTSTTETESSRLPDLHATCGTILIHNGDGSAIDMLSGKPLGFAPNKFFRCSSDRRVVAGTVGILPVQYSRDDYQANLSVRVNGEETEQLPIYVRQGDRFDVSPNGEHLAYFRVEINGSIQLCTMKVAAQPACVEEEHADGSDGFPLSDEISISNLGGVLYTAETEGECVYKDEQHPSRKRLPGYSEAGPCNGIYFWRPSMQSSVQLEGLGRHPQWISPEVAAKLHQWNLTSREKPNER